MNDADFYTIVGYLANPARNTHIEIEIPDRAQTRFASDYARLTGGAALPVITNIRPYYVWPAGTNKWGIEARAYFLSNQNLPMLLFHQLEPRRIQNRPGYHSWDRRISTKRNIYKLLDAGFTIGSPQNEPRIRARVPAAFLVYYLR